jgi:hypothetical protein
MLAARAVTLQREGASVSNEEYAQLDVVASIYDAALDRKKWPDVVATLTSWCGGVVGGLQVRRSSPSLMASMITSGLDSESARDYAQHFFRLDPHFARVNRLAQGRTMLSREVIADAELFQTEFFNDFCRPRGLADLQGAVLLRDETRTVTFATFGPSHQRFDERSRARMGLFVPHLSRALALVVQTDDLADANIALNAAGRERQAGFLRVDREVTVLAATDGLLDWLSEPGTAVMFRDGRLLANLPRERHTLRSAVRTAMTGTSVTLNLTGSSNRLTLVISPAAPSVTYPEPGAFVYLRQGCACAVENTLEATRTLPPSLRRVADALALGLSDKEIAARLDLPIATARTYVVRVRRRLGVTSRRDLISRCR